METESQKRQFDANKWLVSLLPLLDLAFLCN